MAGLIVFNNQNSNYLASLSVPSRHYIEVFYPDKAFMR